MNVTLKDAGYVEKYRGALESIPPLESTQENGILYVKRGFRGLTIEQAIRYLEHLGGERRDERTVVGPGWRAELSSRIIPVGPSYRLTEVTVEWTGEPSVLDPLILRFRVKCFRAPG